MSITPEAFPDPELTVFIDGKRFHEGEYIPLFPRPTPPVTPALFPPTEPPVPSGLEHPHRLQDRFDRYIREMQIYHLRVNHLSEEEKAAHFREMSTFRRSLSEYQNSVAEQAEGMHGRFSVSLKGGPFDEKRPKSIYSRLVLRARFEYRNPEHPAKPRTVTWDSNKPRVVEPIRGRYLQGVSFSLYGYESHEYCVIYQVRMKGEGNSVWCMNGATCGSVNVDVPIEGLTIFVTPIKRSEGLKYMQALNGFVKESANEALENIASDIVKKRSTSNSPLDGIAALFNEFQDDPVAFAKSGANQIVNTVTSEVSLKSQLLAQQIRGGYNGKNQLTAEQIIALGQAEFDKIKDKIDNFLTGDDGLAGFVKDNEFTLLADDLKNMAARQKMEEGLDKALVAYAQEALPRVLETIQDLSKTLSIQFGVEAAAGVGLNAAVGFAFDPNIDPKVFAEKIKDNNLTPTDITNSLDNMEIKGLLGGGVVAGVTFGVSGSAQIGLWKTDISNMSGFSWAVNFEVPVASIGVAGVGVGLSFIFSFDPVEYQGLVISVGGGVGFNLVTLSVGYTHDF